jgi:capsid assembly protease
MNKHLIMEWDNQPWAMVPERLERFFSQVLSIGDIVQAAQPGAASVGLSYQVTGGTAVIPVSGVLLKKVPAWVRYFGMDATGYDEIRGMIDRAVADKAVSQIELRISSPGGQVSGVMETAVAISLAGQTKEVTATIEDLGASAAYWLASRAGQISANSMAEVGSIGVYTVMVDYSAAAEQMGIKVHVVRSGEFKGAGVPGSPITESQLGVMQSIIDGMDAQFMASVAKGRSLSIDDVKALATGRTWLAGEARTLGLIDHVPGEGGPADAHRAEQGDQMPQDSTITQQAGAPAPSVPDQVTQTAVPVAAIDPERIKADERARLASLTADFPDDLAFATDQFSAGHDVQQAKAAYCDVLMERAKKTAAVTATAIVPKVEAVPAVPAANQPSGAPALQFGGTVGGAQSGQDFMARARERARELKCHVTDAVKALIAEDPAAYERFREGEQARTLKVHSGGKASGRVAK